MEKSKMQQLQDFLKEDPSDTFTRYVLALEYLKYGHLAAAETLLNQLIETDKTYIATYYQLGKLLETLKKRTEAMKIYEQGMEQALHKNDRRTYAELKSAYNILMGLDEE